MKKRAKTRILSGNGRAASECLRHRTWAFHTELMTTKPILRRKEEANKMRNDPLMVVQSALSVSQTKARPEYERTTNRPIPTTAGSSDPTAARIARESSERSRALALINEAKRKQAAASLTATPSTAVGGGIEYSDMWNAQEVREARKRRDAVKGWVGEVGRDTREQDWEGRRREPSRDWTGDTRSSRNSLSSRGRGQPRYWEV